MSRNEAASWMPRSRPERYARRRLVPGLLIAALVLGGGTGPAVAKKARAQSKAVRAICGKQDRVLRALMVRTDMLLLGEIHGSAQVPAYALRAVCAALDGSRPVVLGLEIWPAEQPLVDAYLESSGTPDDRRRLLASPFWQRTYQDGRASVAIAELIEGVRRLVAAGFPVSILCFDDGNRPPLDLRDHRMAEYLRRHHAENRGARYVVLTGNVHARTARGLRWNPAFKPMGWHLASAVEHVRSLNARHAPGEFWTCNPECGPSSLGGRGAADARGLELFDERDSAGFDGVFDIGVPTPSPPAKLGSGTDDGHAR